MEEGWSLFGGGYFGRFFGGGGKKDKWSWGCDLSRCKVMEVGV